MISKNIRNFYFILMFCFIINLIWFIGLYNSANDILQYQHKEQSCLDKQINFFDDLTNNDLNVGLSIYNYVFFGFSFLLLLFSVEFLQSSFKEVFYK